MANSKNDNTRHYTSRVVKCPKCQNQNNGYCPLCQGSGYVSELVYYDYMDEYYNSNGNEQLLVE